VTNLLEKLARVKEVLDGSTKLPSHNRPSLLEEERGVAIWTWGLLILNAKDCLTNIITRDWGDEKIVGARWKTRATSYNCTVKRSRGLRSAKQLVIICHKIITHFFERTIKPTITACNSWNEIPPMVVTHEGMEKLRTSVTVL
jgi:hypothetical protein